MKFSTIIILILFTLLSCKEDEAFNSNPGYDFSYINSHFNHDFEIFSQALVHSLANNIEFRSFLKNQILNSNHGDYFILLNEILNKKIIRQKKNGRQISQSVGDLIASAYEDFNLATARKEPGKNAVSRLIEKYPYLQISIPVLADKWDIKKVPVVTFLPEEYNEDDALFIPGFNLAGEVIAVDAVNPPSQPVIVVSLSERISNARVKEIPQQPINFRAITSHAGIKLLWEMPESSNEGNTSGYIIFRKTLYEPQFNLYDTAQGVYNRIYDDINIEPNTIYSYYVQSFHDEKLSTATNIVSIAPPDTPLGVSSFDVVQYGTNKIELFWNNNMDQYIEETRISRKVWGKDDDFKLFGDYAPQDDYTYDRNFPKGKKIVYKIAHKNNLGYSEPSYDVIYAPYRDLNRNYPIYIKGMCYKDNSIEKWPNGAPEFYLTVSKIHSMALENGAYDIQNNIICKFDKIVDMVFQETSFTNTKVMDWQPGIGHSVLCFSVIEFDRWHRESTYTTHLKYLKKSENKQDFITVDDYEHEIKYQNGGKFCGTAYLHYYDEPILMGTNQGEVFENLLKFPKYGVEMLISETPAKSSREPYWYMFLDRN